MEGLTSDDLIEPNSPLMQIHIFFNIKRVLKKLTSINPPIVPSLTFRVEIFTHPIAHLFLVAFFL